jgi:DNA-binding transcriptional regulator YiaG
MPTHRASADSWSGLRDGSRKERRRVPAASSSEWRSATSASTRHEIDPSAPGRVSKEDDVPNVMGVLRAEIRRLARKETKQELSSMKKQLTQTKRLLAESRRRISELESRAKHVARATRGSAAARETAGDEDGPQVRFSPKWVKKHRSKLGMSRLVYAQLIGVSPQTIMGWEAGRTRPRRGALKAWRAIRGKGVRELRAMLTNGSGGEVSRGRKRRGRACARSVAFA